MDLITPMDLMARKLKDFYKIRYEEFLRSLDTNLGSKFQNTKWPIQ